MLESFLDRFFKLLEGVCHTDPKRSHTGSRLHNHWVEGGPEDFDELLIIIEIILGKDDGGWGKQRVLSVELLSQVLIVGKGGSRDARAGEGNLQTFENLLHSPILTIRPVERIPDHMHAMQGLMRLTHHSRMVP